MRRNLFSLLIAALALASGACASAPSPYHAVSEGVLIPPVSTFEPANTELATPRPPAPEVIIDVVEVEWPEGMEPKAAPRPPLPAPMPNNKQTAVPKEATKASVPELQQQINNLLAQVDSLQSNPADRQKAKIERYARELAAKDAELKVTQAERDKALNEIILLKQSEALTRAKLWKTRDLLASTRGGYVQWRAIGGSGREEFLGYSTEEFLFGLLILLSVVISHLAYYFGRERGRLKTTQEFKTRIGALEGAIDGRKLYITELRGTIEKKNAHIFELEQLVKDGFLSRPSEVKDSRIVELEEELGRKRERIQDIKRQGAGPLPGSVDYDPPPETPPDDDNSPESVFGPLERDDGQE